MRHRHRERHRLQGVNWLRAAVLGANDGIVSTASLIVGVAAAQAPHGSLLITGAAGLAAGAMSMATGEYVSVHSQADSERAALAEESAELKADPRGELQELEEIYMSRGLKPALAKEVAQALTAHDPLGSHARDELGLTEPMQARPLQAAMASAASFSVGAAVPLSVVAFVPDGWVLAAEIVASLSCLMVLGGWSARAGGASVLRGVARVTSWSALAMGVSIVVGMLVSKL